MLTDEEPCGCDRHDGCETPPKAVGAPPKGADERCSCNTKTLSVHRLEFLDSMLLADCLAMVVLL